MGKADSRMEKSCKLDWILVGIAALGCVFLISQYSMNTSDIEITIRHSEDLISIIKNGEFIRFYDIVLDKALAGGYGSATYLQAANYNIVLYFILSVIIFPWILFEKIFSFQYEFSFLVFYVKFIILLLDIAAGYLIYRIFQEFGLDKNKSKTAAYLFLSSSITLYATIAFGQLDIIFIIVMLLALLYYAREQYFRFSAIMSIAIMLKMFPLLLFVPLVLLKNKKFYQIVFHGLVGISCTLVFKILFANSAGYTITQEELGDFYNFMGRLVNCNITGSMTEISLFIFCYVIICIWAYNTKVDSAENMFMKMIYTGLLVYGSFSVFVLWHPQWLVLLSLFIAMAIPVLENRKVLLYCDLGIQMFYLLVSALYFDYNADNYMINRGILPLITGREYQGITIKQAFSMIDNALPITFSIFAGIVVMFVYLVYKQMQDKDGIIGQNEGERIIVWSRTGIIYAYILLACVCFFFVG